MSDTVTLPRYVVEIVVTLLESAGVSTMPSWPRRDCVGVLKAALAAPQPVKKATETTEMQAAASWNHFYNR